MAKTKVWSIIQKKSEKCEEIIEGQIRRVSQAKIFGTVRQNCDTPQPYFAYIPKFFERIYTELNRYSFCVMITHLRFPSN